MRTVRDIPVYENIPVLVRAALNVPVASHTVVNDYRLRRALPTIQYLTQRGARVILISHIGEQGTETLEPVARALGRLIPYVSFCPDTLGPNARAAIRGLTPGKILVLENLRRNRGERDNTASFARDVAALGDVFVQDSFDTCHRPHASIIGIPAFLPSYAGLLLEEEVQELSRALSPAHPALAVIAGAKFNTKEPVLLRLLGDYDRVFVGGALANDFLKADGQEVGKSLVSIADQEKVKNVLRNPKLLIPVDSRVVDARALKEANMRETARIAAAGQIEPTDVILDHGPGTSALLADHAARAKTILWNGPLGMYEKGFVDATDALARAIASSKAFSIVGGGDTIAAIEKLGLLPRFSFVSTGGGAMLDFLAKGSLPGIDALNR
ncbi:phosphoglycerate kinase [Patescibacteria group bacterium]|nr:phosphoglycerate kinase [Patescibacteria group bacterium]